VHVIPPTLVAPPGFDPVFVTPDDLEDLSTFWGWSREECLDRLRTYSVREMAEEWRRANPKTPDAIMDFYRKTDLYVWELMQWHASPSRLPYWQTLATLADRYPPAANYHRVYDFGCGVGTDGLFLASHGYDVTLVDIDGPAFHFAKHRFARRGLQARFLTSSSPLPEPDGSYDAIVCFDVFEHLPDPLTAARRLVRALRPGGLLLQQSTFCDRDDHPCHLEAGVTRFAGTRWHIYLASLGLRSDAGLIHRKGGALMRLVQKARFVTWRCTRLWLVRV
jgi:2-polyprenyl-3-methyl-5-hydroxy-6-metoxy-1,4-benzoquinol methylase